MPTPFQRIAIVGGSGHLGPHLVAAFQADPTFDVTIISRQSSKAVFPPTSKVVRVNDDYPKNELVSAFRGHDVVILSLNFQAEKYHNTLVDASREAGVKRLIPSIFGGRHTPAVQEIFPFAAGKAALFGYVVKSASEVEAEGKDWGYTAVSTGLFHELCTQTSFYGIDPASKTATIWDSGNTRFSASTYATMAQAVTAILAKPALTKNQTVYISSFETSLNELLSIYQSVTGASDWKIEHKNSEDGIKEAEETSKTAQDFMTKMRAIGRLALLSSVKEGLGADFVAEGLSWNGVLGLEGEDVEVVTKRILEART